MTYITITSPDDGYDTEDIKTGMILNLIKDHDNDSDDECIKVISEYGIPYGIVANSVSTVVRGTHSAGYIYQMFKENAECEVLFVHEDTAVARLNTLEEE